jgi:hypothetical protein
LVAELPMCDKCLELDKKIERYHRLQFGINDQFAKEGLEQLIAEATVQKLALHPE